MNIIHFNKIDSTHAYAKSLIESGKLQECAIVADEQTAGIGRCNRRWISNIGNVYISIITPKINIDLGQVSLTISCAVMESIAHYMDDKSKLSLHWPNDVHYQNKKISGILMEVLEEWMIISIGVNINNTPNLSTAIGMKDIFNIDGVNLCTLVTPQEMVSVILHNVEKWCNTLSKIGFSHIKRFWLQHVSEIGCNVKICNGNDELRGKFYDIDDSGRLILQTDVGMVYISSGDLFMEQRRIIRNYE